MNEPVFFLLSKRFHMIWISQIIGWPIAWLAQAGFEITGEQTTVLAQVIAGGAVWLFGMAFGKRALTVKPPADSLKGGGSTLAMMIAVGVLPLLLLSACVAPVGSAAPAHLKLAKSYTATVNALAAAIDADFLTDTDIAFAAATKTMVRQAIDRSRCADVWRRHKAVPEPSPFSAEWTWCVNHGYVNTAGSDPGDWAEDARRGISQLLRLARERQS